MVAAQYRLVTEGLGITPPAPGDRQLDGRHAHLDLGRDLSRLHGRAGADGLAADRDVEPQLDDAAPDHRRDPQRSRLEGRQLHRRSRKAFRIANVFFGIATNGGTLAYQKLAPTRETADKLLDAAPGGTVHRRRQRLSSTSGIRRATTIRRPAWSASRPRCWPSTPPTTSAIRRRPASWSARSSA